MYINANLINWSTKSFPVPQTKMAFSFNFASMSTSGQHFKLSLTLNSSSELHDITPNTRVNMSNYLIVSALVTKI